MKTSFVATIFNEANTINQLLDSIIQQTKLPDEVIIVDAGSTDLTIKLIKQHAINKTLTIRLIKQTGLNRSQGRNLGIKSAKHQVIVLSDAGCVLDSHWLERITRAFSTPSIKAVAGYYQSTTNSVLAKCLAPYVATMPDKFNPDTYLPSSRSLALRKSAWAVVGGYAEKLPYCEDLIFAKTLKENFRMAIKADAIVYWQTPSNLNSFYEQLKNYSSGDILAGFQPHILKIISVYLRYLIFFGVPALFFAYLFWPIIKFNRYVNSVKSWVYLPLAQVVADVAVMRGALLGLKLRLERLI
ncbi:MAG: glycosyltransferase [Candidatus Beckwithbacteria bacterium]